MKLLVLAPYPFDTAPSQRYRIEQWIPHLRQSGVEVAFDSFVSDSLRGLLYQRGRVFSKVLAIVRDYVARLVRASRAGRYDAVFLHREAAILGPAWIERVLSARGIPLVYDFDDAIWVPYVSPSNGRFSGLKFPGKTGTICRLAKHVVVGNDTLRAYAVTFNPDVTVIPTTIDTEKYRPRTRYEFDGEPVLGWTGSHSSVQYLERLAPALRRLAERARFKLRLIGVPGLRMPGVNVESLAWNPETEVEDLAPIDIGLMPLPDEEWARGKCACKALQYMGLGIPTVVSPVGVNVELIRDGENGLLAGDGEWVEKLGRLLQDTSLRHRLGQAGAVTVETGFSARAQAPRLMRVLESVTRRRTPAAAGRSAATA